MVSYMYINSLFVLLVLMCLFCFIRKLSLLSSLILLEVITFTMLLFYYAPLLFLFNSSSYFVTLFCFAASGAASGLSLLITVSRLNGSDMIKGLL
uniref:NADH dehydrogenase subunit 4L n=1 Tax=Mastigeulota kiangsinensis TaxID=1544384 RepID=A0A0U1V686_MASKI|nr:NADH dehydrogenase subunit 4L [Mastigeulota kiangsinensis]AIN75492.1 NADH dehydrogenase subunit 4L [Mastigeulota kiangsinensis]